MTTQNEHYLSLLKLILPEEVFDFFEIENTQIEEKEVHVYLIEQDIKPENYSSDKLISKGFYDSITIQDFPLRRKSLFLHVKRRKWLNKNTGNIVNRDWRLVAQGTHYTQGFADFLKGLFGYLPNKQ